MKKCIWKIQRRNLLLLQLIIEVHRKVELQDADITEAQQNAFKDLCVEFNDIYYQVIQVISGKTPLLEVEIDTGDNLPITQKPYTLPLRHTA